MGIVGGAGVRRATGKPRPWGIFPRRAFPDVACSPSALRSTMTMVLAARTVPGLLCATEPRPARGPLAARQLDRLVGDAARRTARPGSHNAATWFRSGQIPPEPGSSNGLKIQPTNLPLCIWGSYVFPTRFLPRRNATRTKRSGSISAMPRAFGRQQSGWSLRRGAEKVRTGGRTAPAGRWYA
jgi:hypothetical protein